MIEEKTCHKSTQKKTTHAELASSIVVSWVVAPWTLKVRLWRHAKEDDGNFKYKEHPGKRI